MRCSLATVTSHINKSIWNIPCFAKKQKHVEHPVFSKKKTKADGISYKNKSTWNILCVTKRKAHGTSCINKSTWNIPCFAKKTKACGTSQPEASLMLAWSWPKAVCNQSVYSLNIMWIRCGSGSPARRDVPARSGVRPPSQSNLLRAKNIPNEWHFDHQLRRSNFRIFAHVWRRQMTQKHLAFVGRQNADVSGNGVSGEQLDDVSGNELPRGDAHSRASHCDDGLNQENKRKVWTVTGHRFLTQWQKNARTIGVSSRFATFSGWVL